MKVEVVLSCITCSHSHEEILELPGCPEYNCPDCGQEGGLYIVSINNESPPLATAIIEEIDYMFEDGIIEQYFPENIEAVEEKWKAYKTVITEEIEVRLSFHETIVQTLKDYIAIPLQCKVCNCLYTDEIGITECFADMTEEELEKYFIYKGMACPYKSERL